MNLVLKEIVVKNNIHYAIYWICIDNMANPDCNVDARLL